VARNGPLIPVVLLGVLIFVALIGLYLVSRSPVRRRAPWLLPEALALSALGLIHLLFFWQPYRSEALVPRGGGDLVSFFFPIHRFAAEEVSSGRLPFWNPTLYSGAPHLANFQTATLYPPNLIAYLLSNPFSYAALERLALLHYLVASVGVYWLARAIGASRPGSVLAGGMFAYSGFMVAHLGHYSMLSTAAWSSFVYAAIVGVVRLQSWPIALAGAVALTLAILGGHQPILLMTLTLAAVLAVFELWRSADYPGPDSLLAAVREPAMVKTVARLGFMALVALMLAAPALGPALQMTGYTVRSGLSYDAASEFSVEPIALLHLVLPTVFGSNPTDYWGPFSNTEMWGYTGVLGLGLALFGLLVWPSRTRVFWAVTAVVSLLFLLGPFAPVHGWAYAFVPGYDQIRGAGRGYMFVNLAVALLAGFGLSALELRRERWFPGQEVLIRRAFIGLAGALVIVVGFVAPLFAVQVLGVNDPGNRPVIALNNVFMLVIWLSLGLAVIGLIQRRSIGRGLLVIVVASVVLLDIFHATGPFNPTTEPILSGFEHEETVAFLRAEAEANDPFRIEAMSPRWQPDLARVERLEDIGGLVDPLALQSYESFLRDARSNRQSEIYQSLNVRFVVTDADGDSPGEGFTIVHQANSGIIVWEADAWMPRARVEQSDATVTTTRDTTDRIVIDVSDAGTAGRLIVSQVNYPGWSAVVDGNNVGVETYNGALQSIELPAGATQVEMTFRPDYWTLWVIIAAGGAALWLAAVVLTVLQAGRRRGRRYAA
jgi:hypothetical protein